MYPVTHMGETASGVEPKKSKMPPSRGPDTFMGHNRHIGELGFYLGVYWDGASFLPYLGHASELSKVPITDSETPVG